MKYHLIAVGGSIMHNLAIDLLDLGHIVTGSDDEIYEPSRSRLQEKGLLPDTMGWDISRITTDIDVIILGKHARSDNPELAHAQKLGLRILSFPEFVSHSNQAKHRIVVTGSHGKTTTTSMIMHVLRKLGYDFDYLVGAQLDGFDKMVRMSGSEILVVEGDEYPSSCLDNRAKMLHYDATIAIVTGVEWDHVNIYKTYQDYLSIFDTFLEKLPSGVNLYFDISDSQLLDLVYDNAYKCTRVGYDALPTDKKGAIVANGNAYHIKVFGNHNLKNMHAAMLVCQELSIEPSTFLEAIASFSGAAKRLELIVDKEDKTVYKDFAHAPSKVKATAEAIREKYPKEKIGGIVELHTFSSLQMSFIKQYADTANSLDRLIVFFDPEAIAHKRMDKLDPNKVKQAFNHPNIVVCDNTEDLRKVMTALDEGHYEVILVMSSGNLGGIDPLDVFHAD